MNSASGLCAGFRAQREGVGLLEYQAMPSWRGVAYDGVLCIFSNGSAQDRYGLSIRYKITPCLVMVTLRQPARLAAVLDQPSSLRPL